MNVWAQIDALKAKHDLEFATTEKEVRRMRGGGIQDRGQPLLVLLVQAEHRRSPAYPAPCALRRRAAREAAASLRCVGAKGEGTRRGEEEAEGRARRQAQGRGRAPSLEGALS